MLGGTRMTTLLCIPLLYVVVFLVCAKNTCIVVEAADIKCIEKERHALLMIKKDLVDHYGHLSSWGDEEDDCCNWRGIRCNNQTHHVTMLDLRVKVPWWDSHYKPLEGKISHSLLELQHLTYLDLSMNDFEQSHIPAFIGSLTKLTYLNLSLANFVGTIPYQLGNLSRLQLLDLSNNDFGGSHIPAFIGSLTKLTYLNLSHACFDGTIPDQLRNLSSIQFLDLAVNNLNSENLSWLSQLSSLRYLDMSTVNLEKAVDWIQAINTLPSLVDLRLSDCSLSSVIPPYLSLLNYSSSSLSVLDLSFNSLTSEIYQWLFNFVGHNLVDLDLSDNQLEGPIPDAFENMTSLAHLDLSWNQIQGGIPNSLGNLLHLQTLYISDNVLNGNLPEIVRNLSGHAMNTLEILDLSQNIICGNVPDITIFSSLKELKLSSNNLNGSLPNRFEHLSKLEVLDMMHNQIKGSLADLSVFSSLRFLGMSYNQITGSLPDLSLFSSLRELYLSNNQINGSIPESIGQLSKLEQLDVSSNNLQGTISEAHFSTLTNLNTLYISNNLNLILNVSSRWLPSFQLDNLLLGSCKLGPRFPVWLRTHRNLSSLDISNAEISDAIPNWFWDLGHNLEFLNMSYNNIIGILPDLSSKFSMKGRIYEYGSILGLVKSIDLSSNKLIGEIPLGITNLSGLIALNLSRNNLVGHIPFDIGHLRMLESLDLSRNRLFGEIPGSISDLIYLSFLNLSQNNLSGKIPSGTQLQRLENSSFAGNLALCGLPLTEKCPGDHTNRGSPTSDGSIDAHIQEDEDEFMLNEWFYASVALGFIVGFWGVCGTLVLHRSWRHAYFRFFENSKDWLYVRIAVHTARMRRKIQSGIDRFL